MFEISLFAFLLSYFFFMWPTILRQLAAMQDADYFYEKYIVFMKAQRKVESMWVMVGFIGANLLLQRMFTLPIYLLIHAAALTVLGLLHLRKPKEKKPRMDKRLTGVCIAAAALLLAIFLGIGMLFSGTFFWEMPFILSFLGFMTDTWILLGNWILSPFVKRAEKRSAKAASERIAAVNQARAEAGKSPLTVVGVAGSYGKSGLISAAEALLSGERTVLATNEAKLGSVGNAGECVIKGLTAEHDAVLMEIMARHPGDVKAFTNAIPVNAGVLTSAAERNLETFLSPERLTETLMELADSLTPQGEKAALAVNYDDERLRKQKAESVRFVRYGSYKGDVLPQHLDLYAKNLTATLDGTSFALCTRDGREQAVNTPLLGTLAAEAAIGAAALALELGVPNDKVSAKLNTLQPLPGYVSLLPGGAWPERIRKRLAKPWETDGELTREKARWRFLDSMDALSIEGARDSLNLLAGFTGFRVLLTAGMYGQGAKEDETNRLLGRSAAKCADAIVVVGKAKFPLIEDGAQRAGFAMGDLHLAANLQDAMARISAMAADESGKTCVLSLGAF